jgi:hypothetical protein
MTEVRSQRPEDRSQRTEVRGQRSEDRSQKSEARGQREKDRGQKSAAVDCGYGVFDFGKIFRMAISQRFKVQGQWERV